MWSASARGTVFVLLSVLAARGVGRFLDPDAVTALFNVEVPGGAVLIEHVDEGSAAARAGLRGGAVPATIQGDDLLLGGDLVVQLEVHRLCAVGVTYLRGGRVGRTVIELEDIPLDELDR
ncbi:MAG TPA: hypothetical protein VFO11_12185 [Candidatus Polarisedimenticolaceae bacterium]|nr:hypothetical protein [Candidatus Polarisedimenticolaceae bacterium]